MGRRDPAASRARVEGRRKQAQGTVRGAYARAGVATADAAGAVRERASTFEEALRASIETRPYMALVAAFCLGWLLSRAGRSS